MRLDVHTHGKLAKKLPFSTTYTDWLFGEARRAGLDALCLTEHFNTLQFADVYGYIASVSRRTGDALELENGLKIFPGMETDVAEGGHILSVGPLEAILELNRRLEPHKEKGNFMPFAQLMDLFEQYPVLVGCGHRSIGLFAVTGPSPMTVRASPATVWKAWCVLGAGVPSP